MLEFDGFIQLLTGLLVPAVLALLGWVGKMSKQVTDLRVMMAEQYVQRSALMSIHDDIEWMKRTLYRVAAKMGVETDRQ
jgi:hypothetical protein